MVGIRSPFLLGFGNFSGAFPVKLREGIPQLHEVPEAEGGNEAVIALATRWNLEFLLGLKHRGPQVSHEKRGPGYLGDEILPSYMGILTNHYKDLY